MRSKLFAVVLGLLTVLLLVMTGAKTARADAIDSVGLSGSEATVTDRYGNVIKDPSTLSKWEDYDINYQWSIEDGTPIADGDTTTVHLPDGAVAANDLSFPMKDSDGFVIGTFTIKAGETSGVITFNDKLASSGTNRHGTLQFYVRGTAIDTNVNLDWKLNKVGWIGGYDDHGNPTTLTWNMAFNPQGKNLGRVVVTDQLGPNQTFIPTSVNAEAGSYNEAGMFIGDGTKLQPTVTVNGSQITFVFDNVQTAVNMTYQSKLTKVGDNGDTWSNNATLDGVTVGGRITWGGSGTGDGDAGDLGSVILMKTAGDTGQSLNGAEYELQDSDGVVIKPTLSTTSAGRIYVADLAPGKYQFVEVKAPDGYELNSTPIPFTIESGVTTPVKLSQSDPPLPVAKGSVTLTKFAKDSTQTLAGAEYELRDASGQTLKTGLTTDAAGQLTVHDLTPGDYQLVETKAPTGYLLNGTPVAVTITAGTTSTAVQVTQSDEPEPAKGAVTLTKFVQDSTQTLAGAEYELQTENGQVLQTGLTTDANGQLTVSDLTPGKYQLVETKAPNGYDLNTDPVLFTIVANATSTPVQVKQSDVATLVKGAVTLTKLASDTAKTLAGATYELQTATGLVLKTNLTTDASGQLTVTELTPGDYQFVETRAPHGYAVDATPIKFTIAAMATAKPVTVTQHDEPLVPPTGMVTLTKVAANSQQPLSGAVYELRTLNGQVLQSDLTTNAQGQLVIKELPVGTYQLIEVKAPHGYELNLQPLTFEIPATDAAVELTMTQVDAATPLPALGQVILAKTAAETQHRLAGAQYALQTVSGQVIKTDLTTDASGTLTVTGLAAGQYQFVETKAPAGYTLNPTPLPFTITVGEMTPVQVAAIDTTTAVTPPLPPITPPLPPIVPPVTPPTGPLVPPIKPVVPGLPSVPPSTSVVPNEPQPVPPVSPQLQLIPSWPSLPTNSTTTGQPGVPGRPSAGSALTNNSTNGNLPATGERRSSLVWLGLLLGVMSLLAWAGWRRFRTK
ncbi:SpaA isopeptide-forming pilin-related protein [Lactiplantibacillus fabifermentans]|nr:SpaA isopeptide-forming pilin-related protein [Lactiplantibacillus fabifermentans]ETY73603.1 hypothetical protein LFAB_11460 [Lactiplantibacillus fabifermentans T30PCM01]